MSGSFEAPQISEQIPIAQPLETAEPSRLKNIISSAKDRVSKVGLALGLVSSLGATLATAETAIAAKPAQAATEFANDYPDMDATDCSAIYGIYSWCKGKPSTWLSSRGYAYRNCTDGAAYWTDKYTGVSVRGWGDAKTWDTGAADAGYAVYSGNTKNIEPGDIAQSDDGPYGHVGFVINVTKNPDGSVASIGTAEMNAGGDGNYTTPTYSARNTAGNFKRGSNDWDHIIDVNGAGKGLNNEDLTTPTQHTVPGPTFTPTMIQRPSGETDVAVVGPANSLDFYYNGSGSAWGKATVPGAQATSSPAIVQRPSGETDIAFQGPGNSMDMAYNAQGKPDWGISHVAAPGWANSAPAMIQRTSGETDIAVQGPDHSLDYYMNDAVSAQWARIRVAGPGSTYSQPAMIQRPSGETDIVVQGPDRTMDYYFSTPNGWGVSHVAANGWANSAPSVVQRSTGETDIAVQGPNGSLDYYINAPGKDAWGRLQVAGAGTTDNDSNPPAMVLRPSGEVDIAVKGPGNQANFSYSAPGGWGRIPVAVGGYSLRAPVMVQRPNTGETDITIVGPDNRLDFYMNEQGKPNWGNIPISGAHTAS